MGEDPDVYDLGEVKLGRRSPSSPAVSRRKGGAVRSGRYDRPRQGRSGPFARPGLAGSLSMFLPGAGQIVAGEAAQGLCFLATTGWAIATACALVSTLDRLLPTLDLLEVPRLTAAVALLAAALGAIALHVCSVVHAHALRGEASGDAPHPLVAGLASLLVPGWGQVLVGNRVRAGIFLASLWLTGAAWLAVTPAGIAALSELGFALPAGARDGWGPVALVTAPIVIWALAVYDAAVAARR